MPWTVVLEITSPLTAKSTTKDYGRNFDSGWTPVLATSKTDAGKDSVQGMKQKKSSGKDEMPIGRQWDDGNGQEN